MVEITEQNIELAGYIIEQLFNEDWHSRLVGERLKDLPKNVSITDFEQHILQFQLEADALRSLDKNFPALLFDGTAIPYSVFGLVSPFVSPLVETVFVPELLRLQIDRFFNVMRPVIELLDELYEVQALVPLHPDQAKLTLIKRAVSSLALRIANAEWTDVSTQMEGVLNFPQTYGASVTIVPGCNFEVNTNTHGLQVFWSGAYYIKPFSFGGPTSPASGLLQSGTYVFGVKGGSYTKLQWDQTAICSLPGTPRVYLTF